MPDIITAIGTWAAAQAPAGADLCTALSVKDSAQTLANRDQYLYELAPSLFAVVWTATTVGWVAPAGVQYALAFGCGGGGGGGGGRNGFVGTNGPAVGGGGGGGARFGVVPVPLVAGDAYDIAIGAGGAAGIGGTSPAVGGAGGTTSFTKVSSGSNLAVFRGAGGGGAGNTIVTGNETVFHLGGGPLAADEAPVGIGWGAEQNLQKLVFDSTASPFQYSSFFRATEPGEGGAAKVKAAGHAGRRGLVSLASVAGGFLGGAGGALGTDSGSYVGGSGGGGGGAGPWGAGAAGGGGGSGNAMQFVRDGYVGDAAAANTGAGGGGGGAGAGHVSSAGVGGSGGAGGSGRLILIYSIKG